MAAREVMERLALPATRLRAEWRGHLDWVTESMDDLERCSLEAMRNSFSLDREYCLSLQSHGRQLELLCGSLLLAIEWCGKRYGSGFEDSFENATAEASRLRQRAARCARRASVSAYFCDKRYDAAVLFGMYETRQHLDQWLSASAHPVTQLGADEREGFGLTLALVYSAADVAFAENADHRQGLRQAERMAKLLCSSENNSFADDATCVWLADAADGLRRSDDAGAESAAVACAWRASRGVRHQGARLAVASRLARLATLAPDAVVAALAALGEERAMSEAWLELGDPRRALVAAKLDPDHVFQAVDVKLAIKFPLNASHEAALARRLSAKNEGKAAATFLLGRRKYSDLGILFSASSRQDKLVDVAARLASTILPSRKEQTTSVFAKEFASAASGELCRDEDDGLVLNRVTRDDNEFLSSKRRAPTDGLSPQEDVEHAFSREQLDDEDVDEMSQDEGKREESSDEDELQNGTTCGTNDAVVEDASSLIERAADEDVESEVLVEEDDLVASTNNADGQGLVAAEHHVDAAATSFQDDNESEVVMEDHDVPAAATSDEQSDLELDDRDDEQMSPDDKSDSEDEEDDDAEDDAIDEDDAEDDAMDEDDDDEFPSPDAVGGGTQDEEEDDGGNGSESPPQASDHHSEDDGGLDEHDASESEQGELERDEVAHDAADDEQEHSASQALQDESETAAAPPEDETQLQVVEEGGGEEEEEEDAKEATPPAPAPQPPLANIPEEDGIGSDGAGKARPKKQRSRRTTRLSNASNSSRESATSALTDIDVSNIIRGPRLRRHATRS